MALEDFVGPVFNVLLVAITIIVIVAIGIAMIWLHKQKKKWSQYTIIIHSTDAYGNTLQKFDIGGVFTDKKTGNKRLFIKNNKASLSADNIPVVMGVNGKKYIYLLEYGIKNFSYMDYTRKGLDDLTATVGEEDVNWALNVFEAWKNRLQSKLAQYLPLIIIVVALIVSLVMLIYVTKSIGTLAGTISGMQDTAKLQNESAFSLLRAEQLAYQVKFGVTAGGNGFIPLNLSG